MLVFTNKGEKVVRLFDDFYPLKEEGPNITINIWIEENGKKKDKPIAWYYPLYRMERLASRMKYIKLYPEQKLEVPIKDVKLLLKYFPLQPQPFVNGEKYELEVRFKDGYGERGVRREYVGKEKFSPQDQTPK